MKENGKIYFASDFHLGLATGTPTLFRERKVVSWLKKAAEDAKEIYLLGDIFDFWWEYKLVVPRGYTRFLGTVAEITDSGIPVHFFTGNHDMWVRDYLSSECGMTVHTAPVTIDFNGKKFHLAHGEGLGTTEAGYKILLSIFRSKILRAMYSSLHPSIGVGIGHMLSLNSRLGKGLVDDFYGEEKEDLLRYARTVLVNEKIDYFVFGHRHLGMIFRLKQGAEVLILGDWIKNGSFGEWDGQELRFTKL